MSQLIKGTRVQAVKRLLHNLLDDGKHPPFVVAIPLTEAEGFRSCIACSPAHPAGTRSSSPITLFGTRIPFYIIRRSGVARALRQ